MKRRRRRAGTAPAIANPRHLRRRTLSVRGALREIASLERFRSQMRFEADKAELMAIARAIEAIDYNQKSRDRREGAREAGFDLKRARDLLRSARRREERATNKRGRR